MLFRPGSGTETQAVQLDLEVFDLKLLQVRPTFTTLSDRQYDTYLVFIPSPSRVSSYAGPHGQMVQSTSSRTFTGFHPMDVATERWLYQI
jgi:hypothetical protein